MQDYNSTTQTITTQYAISIFTKYQFELPHSSSLENPLKNDD